MSTVTIADQQVPVVWSASGSIGNSFEHGIFWYEKLPLLSKASKRIRQFDVMPTTKSLGLYPIVGHTPLQPNGETPQKMFPRSILIDFWTATTLNAFGHTGRGLSYELMCHNLDHERDWVLSLISDQLDWDWREKEWEQICELLRKYPFPVPPIIEPVFGCPSVKLSLDEMFNDCPDVIALLKKNLPGFIVGANISPIAGPGVFFEAADAGADYLRICNTIPHWFVPDPGCAGLPEDIPWREHSPLQDRYGVSGGYSGPMCAEIVLERLGEVAELAGVPVGFGNGFYTKELIARGFDAGGAFLSLGMAKAHRWWRVPDLIDFAHQYAAEVQQRKK